MASEYVFTFSAPTTRLSIKTAHNVDYFLKTKRWKKIGCGLTKVICPVLCFEMLIRSFRCVGFKNASFLLQNQTRKRRVCLGLTVGSSSGNLQVLVGIRVGFSGSFQQLHFFFICIFFSLFTMNRHFLLNLLS